MKPRYRGVTRDEIPRVRIDGGVEVAVICGEVEGKKGPVRDIVIDPQYLDVSVPPGVEYRHTVKDGHTVFAYVLEGSGWSLILVVGVPNSSSARVAGPFFWRACISGASA